MERQVIFWDAESMSSLNQARATLDDLYRTPGQAELISGKILRYRAAGHLPSIVVGRLVRSLEDYATQTGRGHAFTSTMGFAIPELPSGRESFSPDASYYYGPLPENRMRFIEGPPTFAVEVRSENDYSRAAEIAMADKRADYFAAGTQVVWDVDPVEECVQVYRASEPQRPTTYAHGEIAEAEPALPGWSVAVDWIFS